jgi:uncharacterized protein (TIGR02246 family)
VNDTDDVVAVLQVVAAFNHCVDFGDGDRFGQLFTDDGVLDMGHLTIIGREALIDFANGVKDRVPNPRHIVSNTWVELAGDTAAAHSYAHVYVTPEGSVTTLKSAGRYEDDLVRTTAGWRFQIRRFVSDPAPAL